MCIVCRVSPHVGRRSYNHTDTRTEEWVDGKASSSYTADLSVCLGEIGTAGERCRYVVQEDVDSQEVWLHRKFSVVVTSSRSLVSNPNIYADFTRFMPAQFSCWESTALATIAKCGTRLLGGTSTKGGSSGLGGTECEYKIPSASVTSSNAEVVASCNTWTS